MPTDSASANRETTAGTKGGCGSDLSGLPSLTDDCFRRSAEYGTLPTDFRSPSENGPSRYGHLTARFARGRGKTRHTTLRTGMRFSVLTAEASVDRLARAA